jgi:hypothetical protein
MVSYSAGTATALVIFYILARVESLSSLILAWLQAGYKNESRMKLAQFSSVEPDRAV